MGMFISVIVIHGQQVYLFHEIHAGIFRKVFNDRLYGIGNGSFVEPWLVQVYCLTDGIGRSTEQLSGSPFGQYDGIWGMYGLFPTACCKSWREYFLIQTVRFHHGKIVRKHFTVWSADGESLVLCVRQEREGFYGLPFALADVCNELSGNSADCTAIVR